MKALLFGMAALMVSAQMASPAIAEVRLATWNVREAFTAAEVAARAADFDAAADMLQPDILMVQEIASCEAAEAIRNVMRLQGYHVACTDFSADGDRHNSFEVAIISRFALADVTEFDPTPDTSLPGVTEVQLLPSDGVEAVPTHRGFLWARVPEVNLSVAVVHLKSARGRAGQQDATNAREREMVISAVAKQVVAASGRRPGDAILVAGDFNVGHSDRAKNGRDLTQDCFSRCGSKDLYDDTHAILSAGLVDGLRMRNLVAGIRTSTFPRFPGSPIDNIYVLEPQRRFADARKSDETFGSDHLAVWTTMDGPVPGSSRFSAIGAVSMLGRTLPSVDSYYASVDTSTPDRLRRTLHDVIANSRRLSYGEVWDALAKTDAEPDRPDHVRLIYSETSVPVTNWERDPGNNRLPTAWNREHVWPKSHGFPERGQAAHTDIHHLRPSDKDVNSRRGNLDFDVGGNLVPETRGARRDSDSFEPPDADKGAVARMMFYMAIRYEGDGANGNLELSRGQTAGGTPSIGHLCVLLGWHQRFGVTNWERGRNGRIYEIQGNRNPFVDNPGWVTQLWGGQC
ncbi:endonuclease [Azospirillum sp. HJ39]|uniref:endonuclease n=1 Tax=Azospirillum sp. HJ39 TaxID=3159496 RepID=UPI003558F10D